MARIDPSRQVSIVAVLWKIGHWPKMGWDKNNHMIPARGPQTGFLASLGDQRSVLGKPA